MPAQHYCLIGHPLGHSISPQIHRRLFALSGQAGTYVLNPIPPGIFEREVEKLRGLRGFNITIPYKRAILPFLKSLSEKARGCGAVNTVAVREGEFYGYNTDGDGFVWALSQAGIALSGDVLLCGAGGAAAVMAWEALSRGCRLFLSARSREKAAEFAQKLRERFPSACVSPLEPGREGERNYDLILNATPSGMFPDVSGSPLPPAAIGRAGAVFDAVYNPRRTVLLAEAAAAGAKAQGGLPMLVYQAAAAQTLWTGARFRDEDLLAVCEEMAALL